MRCFLHIDVSFLSTLRERHSQNSIGLSDLTKWRSNALYLAKIVFFYLWDAVFLKKNIEKMNIRHFCCSFQYFLHIYTCNNMVYLTRIGH